MKQVFAFLSFLFFVASVKSQNIGIGTNTPASSALLDVSSTKKGFLLPRMTTAQRDSIGSPATGLTIYNISRLSVEVYNGYIWHSPAHYVGENYGGGVVFFVYDFGEHGLIAATTDQGTDLVWASNNWNTNARASGVGAGLKNTLIAIANPTTDTTACALSVCNRYSVNYNNYSNFLLNSQVVPIADWYLPSDYELRKLLTMAPGLGIGITMGAFYWSSTEINENTAYASNGGPSMPMNKTTQLHVRAIRAF